MEGTMNKTKALREEMYRHSEKKANTERQRKIEERDRDGEHFTKIQCLSLSSRRFFC